jgi:hypothetical protein
MRHVWKATVGMGISYEKYCVTTPKGWSFFALYYKENGVNRY